MSGLRVDALDQRVDCLSRQLQALADKYSALHAEHRTLYIEHTALQGCLKAKGIVLPREMDAMKADHSFPTKLDIGSAIDVQKVIQTNGVFNAVAGFTGLWANGVFDAVAGFAGLWALRSFLVTAASCNRCAKAVATSLENDHSICVYLAGGTSGTSGMDFAITIRQWRFPYEANQSVIVGHDLMDLLTYYDSRARTWTSIQSHHFEVSSLQAKLPMFIKRASHGFIFFAQHLGWHWFDCRDQQWTILEPPATPYQDLGIRNAAVFGSRLFVLFGMQVKCISIPPGRFSDLPLLPQVCHTDNREQVDMFNCAGYLYLVFHHIYGTTAAATLVRYDARSDIWTHLKSPPSNHDVQQRHAHIRFVVCAGVLHAIQEPCMHRLSPETLTWEAQPNMPTARHGVQIVSSSWYIYVLGGVPLLSAGTPVGLHQIAQVGLIERFNARTSTWEKLPALPHGLPATREVWYSATAVSDELYVFRVHDGMQNTGTQCWVYKRGHWENLPPHVRARRGALAVAL